MFVGSKNYLGRLKYDFMHYILCIAYIGPDGKSKEKEVSNIY